MFLAIVFIVLGIILLLNALGIFVTGNLWGFFWAIVFIAIGLKLLMKKGKCPMCCGAMWSGKMHNKMHQKTEGCCGCDCEHDEDREDHQ